MKKFSCAVLGCTGLVGQCFVKLLHDHPFFEIKLLTASEISAGKIYGESVKWAIGGNVPTPVKDKDIKLTSEEEILKAEVEIVFSALPAKIGGPLEDSLRKKGIYVFSNSSAHRMDSDVPILIPEINSEHLQLTEIQRKKYGGFIVTNSNCTTSGLVLSLKPLLSFKIKRILMSSYQSISGAGRRGLPSMEILGNAIPFVKEEEEKVERETRKILGDFDGEIITNCCRVPIKIGHLESVVVEFEKDFEIEETIEKFRNFRGVPQHLNLPTAPENPVIVKFDDDRPQPELDAGAGEPERAKGMAITIGRLRKKGKFLTYFLLVNNLIRGSAGGSVLNAELAFQKGILRR
ncbi:MAG: aspartate-semialdehyde dehydrogenase [Candidatus Aminicenantia bacterium]